MDVPRGEERFTPGAVAARELARSFGSAGRQAASGYITRGEATEIVANSMADLEGTAALTAAGKFVVAQAKRHHRHNPSESYYGAGQAVRDAPRKKS